MNKGQSSNNLNVGLSQQGFLWKKLRNAFAGGEWGEHSPESGPKRCFVEWPESSSNKDLGYDSEKYLNSYVMSLSGANSMVSGQSVSQNQNNVLKELK